MGKRHSLRPVCAQPGRHSLKPTLKGYFYTNLVGTLISRPTLSFNKSAPNAQGLSAPLRRAFAGGWRTLGAGRNAQISPWLPCRGASSKCEESYCTVLYAMLTRQLVTDALFGSFPVKDYPKPLGVRWPPSSAPRGFSSSTGHRSGCSAHRARGAPTRPFLRKCWVRYCPAFVQCMPAGGGVAEGMALR
jgi:hypothetical protein